MQIWSNILGKSEGILAQCFEFFDRGDMQGILFHELKGAEAYFRHTILPAHHAFYWAHSSYAYDLTVMSLGLFVAYAEIAIRLNEIWLFTKVIRNIRVAEKV